MIILRCMALIMTLALCLPGPANADKQSRKWKEEETRCLEKCPPMPSFSGTETDAQYGKRIQAQDAHNQCRHQCTQEYLDKVNSGYQPWDDGSQGYYKRNTF